MIHMGVAQKWHFSTSGGAANLGGVSGDLFEHRRSGIPLLGITSLNRHFYAQIDWARISILFSVQCTLNVHNVYCTLNTPYLDKIMYFLHYTSLQ